MPEKLKETIGVKSAPARAGGRLETCRAGNSYAASPAGRYKFGVNLINKTTAG
jgi:hypothetical protein